VSSLDGDNFSSIESETSEDEPEFIRDSPPKCTFSTSNNAARNSSSASKRIQQDEVDEYWTNTNATKSIYSGLRNDSTTRKRTPTKKFGDSLLYTTCTTSSRLLKCTGCCAEIDVSNLEDYYSDGGKKFFCILCSAKGLAKGCRKFDYD
jgi:hypothetical protein